ncbi:efflux RND transporter periplasmic adaptor subunit [Brevundimonas diminuta]|uniref:efflux RND transporter periplasmic adaptor subunit n=1 Tax=Brevundimonas diminuta TaxID=293 RepID=UPI0022AECF2C|nr:efflux RND transporter periplasmic adaptor subunit [Brevundimonas diminuta]MCZ4109458.1 efflux RND transporter periplasmic adaptor subunit [Brevundimonas diminuta]
MSEHAKHATSSTGSAGGAAMDRRLERQRTPWWRRRAVLAVVALAVVGGAAWRLLPSSGSTNIAAADVETGVVQRAAFDDYIPVRAVAAPRISTLVGALAGGQVERLLVEDGVMVAEGQPLAVLSNPELKLEVLTREAQIVGQLGDASAQNLGLQRNRLDREAQIDQASYDLLRARREHDIRRQLYERGFLSEAGVRSFAEEAGYQENRLKQLQAGQVTESRITAAQANRLAEVRQRLAGNLEAVRAGLDALVIRAPTAGRLTNFSLQPGQALKAGDPAGQVDSEGAWKLEADVDEYYLGRITAGQKARTSEGATLTVSRVLPAVSEGRFKVELTFDGRTPNGLNRGQTLDLRITLGAARSALVAPVGGWLEGAGDAAKIFVLDKDGAHARRRPIELGRRNPTQVEILSGLSPGDRIVTSNTASIRGDKLNIRGKGHL